MTAFIDISSLLFKAKRKWRAAASILCIRVTRNYYGQDESKTFFSELRNNSGAHNLLLCERRMELLAGTDTLHGDGGNLGGLFIQPFFIINFNDSSNFISAW